MAFLMKVLSGPHGGAEVALDEGTYLIGSDDSCDFVLNDASVTARHCRIDVEAGSMAMVVLEGTVWNGERRFEKGETVPVTTGTLYRLGTTVVSFLREGEPWEEPTLSFPYAEEATEVSEPEPAAEHVQPSARESVSEVDRKKTLPKKGTKLAGLLVTALLVILSVTALLLWYGKQPPKEKPPLLPAPSVPNLEDLRNFLDSQGYASLRLNTGAEGIPVISGVVPSEAKRLRLRKLLAARGYSLRLRVLTAEDVREVVASLLTGMGAFRSEVTVDDEGTVHVSGYLPDSRDLEQLRHTLQSDLPVDDLPIQWNIRTLDEAERGLRKLLAERHLDGLQTKRLDHAISVVGVVTPSQEAVYREILKRFSTLYGEGILKDEVKVEAVATPPSHLPSLEVEAVVLGSQRFILTTSGRRIDEGEEVENGYILEAIEKDRIIIRRDNEAPQSITVQPSIVMQYAW